MSDTSGHMVICRCEDVTHHEIIEAIANGARTASEVKWRTRAGMGLCQGKTCGRLVAGVIAEETGVPEEKVIPSTSRAPVRPAFLGALAARPDGIDEDA